MEIINLFDNVNRTYDGPANHKESTFSFLSRSASKASNSVRAILEEWFTRYPDQHRLELRRRFQADFLVGFFELLLHELLLRFNHKVEVNPPLPPPQRTRPDYRATSETTNSVYLEATVVTDESKEEKARNKVLSTLYDQIDQLEIPDYFLRIKEIRNSTGRQPSGKRVKQFLRKCLEDLDYDDLTAISHLGAINYLPTWTYKQEEIEIDFGVIPVSPENRGKLNHRFIGMYPACVRWGGTDSAIRAAIRKKATKFGQLDAPYIIAVNCVSKWGTDHIDEMQALFGTEEFVSTNLNQQPQFRQKPDGIWFGPKGPRNRRISGVIIAKVVPWNLPGAEICLYQNPWAYKPYQGPLTSLPQTLVINGASKRLTGHSLGSIFSLAESWPGQLFER